jgi:phytoene synthase
MSAEAVTAASGSNLALALRVLPQGRRRDMRVFYAFCRIVDDLADEPGLPLEQRLEGLQQWRLALLSGRRGQGAPSLASSLLDVFARHEVPVEWAVEVVLGCEMDLEGTRYRTWEDLRKYCYRVASAVGLVSARIFGGAGCECYAEQLGIALQLTNILRDVSEDFSRHGRVYLPEEDLERFGVDAGSWVKGPSPGWSALMRFETKRARGHYEAAVASMPRSQLRPMVAAEIMRRIYGDLLDLMERDGFRVWNRAYRLSRGRKLWLALSAFSKTLLMTAGHASGPLIKLPYVDRVWRS